MNKLTLAGVILALALPTFARAQSKGATAVANNACPSANYLNIGNNRPLVETQWGQLCVQLGAGGATVLGHVITDTGSVTSINGGAVGLLGGSQLVGKFGIDQTTPGTTNGVVLNSSPTGASATQIQGASASGSASIGNPVGVGGVYNSTLPTYTNAQRSDAQPEVDGSLRVSLVASASSGVTSVTTNNAFVLVPGSHSLGGTLATGSWLFNGTTNIDQARDIVGTIAAGTGTAGVAEAPHQVALFTPAVVAGVSTLTLAGAKNLYTAYLTNTDTVVHWLWIVNTSSAPVNGSFSAGIASGNNQDCVEVAAGTTGSIGGLPIPEPFSVQPYMANSTTGCGAASSTLTLSTVGFMHLLAK